MALAAPSAFGQEPNLTSRSAASSGTPIERMDLGESSKACAEVSRFLAQPKLSEALAAIRADKKKAEEARRNANEFLAQYGVRVPAGVKVKIDPSGGAAAKVKVDVKITCCPLTVVITISW
ncbi:MAG: hypothetical protein V1750_10035 [Acidobacteriota bacterium]